MFMEMVHLKCNNYSILNKTCEFVFASPSVYETADFIATVTIRHSPCRVHNAYAWIRKHIYKNSHLMNNSNTQNKNKKRSKTNEYHRLNCSPRCCMIINLNDSFLETSIEYSQLFDSLFSLTRFAMIQNRFFALLSFVLTACVYVHQLALWGRAYLYIYLYAIISYN